MVGPPRHGSCVTDMRSPASPRRRIGARVLTAAAGSGLMLALAATPAAAHERWFVDQHYGSDWGFLFSPLPLALLAVVVATAVAWRAVSFHLPTPELPFLAPVGRLTPYIPRLLGIHVGVSLLAYAVTGSFLAPSLPLADVPGGDLAGLVEGALGVWFITGVRLRPAAYLLAAVGPLALLGAGPVAMLETADLLGIAVFLAVLPPSDATFGAVAPTARQLRTALIGLRVGVAVALVALAFSEKFTNPAMARATLVNHPQLDVFGLVGISVSPDTFVALAGAVEVLFGLLVLSGAMPQVAVLVAGIPFNATLLLFGATELIGHLPVYGVFLTLLAYGSDRRTAESVRALRIDEGATAAAPAPRSPVWAGPAE
jgi:hypothetical protein